MFIKCESKNAEYDGTGHVTGFEDTLLCCISHFELPFVPDLSTYLPIYLSN